MYASNHSSSALKVECRAAPTFLNWRPVVKFGSSWPRLAVSVGAIQPCRACRQELANATSILEPLIAAYCTSPAKMLPSCFFTPAQYRIIEALHRPCTCRLPYHTVFAALRGFGITWSQDAGRGFVRRKDLRIDGIEPSRGMLCTCP